MFNYYNPSEWIAAYQVDSTAELPNVDGAALQTPALTPNQLALVRGARWFCCYSGALGAAVWYEVFQPSSPFALPKQVYLQANDVVPPDARVLCITTSDANLTLPTVLQGAPIGTTYRIIKTTTDTDAFGVQPADDSQINGGTAGAAFTLPGSDAVLSDTDPAPEWFVTRTGALDWTVSASGAGGSSGGGMWTSQDITVNGALDGTVNVVFVTGSIYVGLPAQTQATTQLVYTDVGFALVPNGYPSSTQTINGSLNMIATISAGGTYWLRGDGAGAWGIEAAQPVPKSDFTETHAAPTSSADNTLGWSVGSQWFDTNKIGWVCVDASTGAAIWLQFTSPVPFIKNNFTGLSAAPTNMDDDTQGYSTGSGWVDSSGDAWTCISAGTGGAIWKKTTP